MHKSSDALPGPLLGTIILVAAWPGQHPYLAAALLIACALVVGLWIARWGR